MNILMINPSSMSWKEQKELIEDKSISRHPGFSMPIGLVEMISYIKNNVDFIDNIEIADYGVALHKIYCNNQNNNSPNYTINDFLEKEIVNSSFKPDIVGIRLMFASSYLVVSEISKIVKTIYPDSAVCLGGNHATNIYRELLNDCNVNYVVRGEGELSFLKLLKSINSGSSINVKGVYDKNKIKSNISNVDEVSDMLSDLTEIRMPSYELLDMKYYASTVGAGVMWTRGCPYKCTFCATTTVHGRKLRYKTVEQCLAEIKYLVKKFSCKVISIEDDLFAPKKDFFLSIVDRILREIGEDLQFEVPQGLSVAVMDEDRIDAMLRLGVNSGALAIETGSEYVNRKIFKKNVDLVKAKKILEYMRKVGFRCTTNFILGAPGETHEMRLETIEFARSIDVDWIYIFHALPLPGSEMFSMFEDTANVDDIDWDSVRLGKRDFDTSEINAEELEDIVYDLNIELNFFNNSNYIKGRYSDAIKSIDEFVLQAFPFHIVAIYIKALSLRHLANIIEYEQEMYSIIEYIKNNKEANELFIRYGDKMDDLRIFADNKHIELPLL